MSESLVVSAGKVLNDTAAPLKARFRALFALRGLGGADAIAHMTKSLDDPAAGALLKHEVAYCLGQMRDKTALPTLVRVLEDVSREAIVRHEAGEAIAAIGGLDAIDALRKYCSDPVQEVADTCQIAVNKLEYETTQQFKDEEGHLSKNPYESVDPAPPLLENDVQILRSILLDESKTLFERYRAMFSLRNIGSEESITAIADGFRSKNTLFRHEVAYVLGQIQSAVAEPQLLERLRDAGEIDMVRHECAEALGSIASHGIDKELEKYTGAEVPAVLRESCVVALDFCEYFQGDQFQYARA